MSAQVDADVEIVELTPEESMKAFDQIARREMGLSGEEFLARWKAGEWKDIDLDEVPGLVDVWMALPMAMAMVRNDGVDAGQNAS